MSRLPDGGARRELRVVCRIGAQGYTQQRMRCRRRRESLYMAIQNTDQRVDQDKYDENWSMIDWDLMDDDERTEYIINQQDKLEYQK